MQGETDKPDSWFVSPEQTCSPEKKVLILYYKHFFFLNEEQVEKDCNVTASIDRVSQVEN